jgi:hypothetical protein
MAELKLDLNGKNGIIALGVVVLAVSVRLLTLGNTDDPALREAVRAELRNSLGGQLGAALDAMPEGDPEAAAEIAAMASEDSIRIHATSVSKPLLSFSSSAKTVVKVEYELPGNGHQTAYWRFRHSMVGGWQYRGRGSAVSYYLNFL